MPRDSLVGCDIAGRFHITEPIGEGSVGDVYLAEHAVLKRRFAIKLLKRHFLHNPTITERFRREALVASRLNHPSIVEISDFGQTSDGRLYLVMEYVEGPTLGWLIESALPGVVSQRRALRLLDQIAGGLAAAHDAGVIHRDLKPDNIMVTRDAAGERVKILDFGLAKIMVDAGPLVLTRRGQMFGTPLYMSPEQARGEEIDSRTDIYAFGAIAYELLTGRPLFLTDALDQLLVKTQTEMPPAPSKVQPPGTVPIAPELDEVCLACLAKDRDHRPLRITEVAAVIRRCLERLRASGKPYAQTVEYDKLELSELQALEAEAAAKAKAAASVSEARGRTSRSGEQGSGEPRADEPRADEPRAGGPGAGESRSGEQRSGESRSGEQRPGSLGDSIQITTIVELDPYYWRRICTAAVRLAKYLQARGQLGLEAIGLLASLVDLEGRMETLERELAGPREMLRAVDQECREQEGQLRHAVIDLSLKRGALAEAPEGDPASLAELDARIRDLETQLAAAYRAGRRRRAVAEREVAEREERVEQMRQMQLELELQLLEALRQQRPDPGELSEEANQAFDHLEQLLLEVT